MMIRELDGMISNPSLIEPLKLNAMDVLIRTMKMCYSIVRDVDVEEIQAELDKIKASTEEREVDFAPLDFEEDTPGPG